jgi:hypothetical protein
MNDGHASVLVLQLFILASFQSTFLTLPHSERNRLYTIIILYTLNIDRCQVALTWTDG